MSEENEIKAAIIEEIREIYDELGKLGITIPFRPSELNRFSDDDLVEELDARRNQLENRRRFMSKTTRK